MPRGKKKSKREELVLLKDLVPQKDPKGGRAPGPVFGEHTVESDEQSDRGARPADDGARRKKGS